MSLVFKSGQNKLRCCLIGRAEYLDESLLNMRTWAVLCVSVDVIAQALVSLIFSQEAQSGLKLCNLTFKFDDSGHVKGGILNIYKVKGRRLCMRPHVDMPSLVCWGGKQSHTSCRWGFKNAKCFWTLCSGQKASCSTVLSCFVSVY